MSKIPREFASRIGADDNGESVVSGQTTLNESSPPAVPKKPPKAPDPSMSPADTARWMLAKFSRCFQDDYSSILEVLQAVKLLEQGFAPPNSMVPPWGTGQCLWKDEWKRIAGLVTHSVSPAPRMLKRGHPKRADLEWHKGEI